MSLIEIFSAVVAENTGKMTVSLESISNSCQDLNDTLQGVNDSTKDIQDSFTTLIQKIADSAKSQAGGITNILGGKGGIAGTIATSLLQKLPGIISSEASEFIATSTQGKKSAEKLGIGMERVQAWQKSGMDHGDSAEGFNREVSALQKRLNRKDRKTLKVLQELEIKPFDDAGKRKNTEDILLEIGDGLKNLNDEKKAKLVGEQLGFNPEKTKFLAQGSTQIKEEIDGKLRLGMRTEQDAQVSQDYLNAKRSRQTVFATTSAETIGKALPVVTDINNSLTETGVTVNKGLQDVVESFRKPPSLDMKNYGGVGTKLLIRRDDQPDEGAAVSKGVPSLLERLPDILRAIQSPDESPKTSSFERLKKPDPTQPTIKNFDVPIKKALTRNGRLEPDTLQLDPTIPQFVPDPLIRGKAPSRGMQLVREQMEKEGQRVSTLHPGLMEFPAFPQVESNLLAGQQILAATNNPFASRDFGSPERFAQQVHNENNVTVSGIAIHTQAQDAEGISIALGDALVDQISNAIEHFDDGMAG